MPALRIRVHARPALRCAYADTGTVQVTDGRSAAYFSLTGGPRLRFALENWPFKVETKYGVAAVQYADGQDVDSAGDETTGMFGCTCADAPEGLVLSCASVPYQEHTGDAATTTVHPMNWERPAATRGLLCEEVAIQVHMRILLTLCVVLIALLAPPQRSLLTPNAAQVMSLRFSRRRFSQTLGGVDVANGDPHGTAEAPRTYLSNTADAAVYVYPKCNVQAKRKTDTKCMPDNQHNCFPWCMGVHVAGRKNQQIVMYSQDTWENNVNVAKTDCAIDADEVCSPLACSAIHTLALRAVW